MSSSTPGGAMPLRIEMVLPSLVAAGMEVLVARMVRLLAERGFDVGVTCLESTGVLAEALRDDGFRVTLQSAPGLRPIVRAPALERWFRERRPDVVHVHSGAWLKAAGAGRRAGVPRVVCTVHGLVSPEPWHGPPLMHWAARRTDQVVAVSASLREYLARTVRVPRRKLSVILNGIDLARFAPGPRDPALLAELGLPTDALVVGHVARLDPVKNQRLLLDAFARVRATLPAARLLVIGDGPERATLEAQVGALGLASAVRLAGSRSDVARLYRAFDVFALSSHTEGTSMSLLEAMASGVPAVATAVGGTPALLDGGRCGVLVPPGDAGALAGALEALLREPARRAGLAQVARAHVTERYAEPAMIERYECVYRGAMTTDADTVRGAATCAA